MRRQRGRPSNRSIRQTWMAAAWGHCRNGNHAAEWKCRNAARMHQGMPPLTDLARCLVKS